MRGQVLYGFGKPGVSPSSPENKHGLPTIRNERDRV